MTTNLLLIVANLVAVPLCPQIMSRPDCVTVPTVEAAQALDCVAADLPECLEGRHNDAQLCSIDRHEAVARFDAAMERATLLQTMLDDMPSPPVVPWFERPAVVATSTAAAILGALWMTR